MTTIVNVPLATIQELMKDPAIINFSLGVGKEFSWENPHLDFPAVLTDYYIKVCASENRAPVSTNPSHVRWAVDSLRNRWNRILERRT